MRQVTQGSGAPHACAAAGVALLILLPTLLYPYGRDQSVFAYMGDVIARGGMPYRDAWELKPPGIYLCYALLARLTGSAGQMMAAVRMADVLLACLAAAGIAALAVRWGRPETAVPAAAWYASLYLHGGYWSMAQAESWANPLIVGAALLCAAAARKRSAAPESAAAGFLAGCVILLKFTAVVPLVPFLLLAVWSGQDRWPNRAALLLAGALAPCLAAFVWLKAGGGWEPYLDIQRGFVAPYVRMSAPGPGRWVTNLFGYTLGWAGRLWLPAALAVLGAVVLRRAEGWGGRLTTAAFGLGLAVVWVQGKYFLYHWEQALPWMALLAASGAALILRAVRLPARALPAAGTLVALAWTALAYGGVYRDAARLTLGQLPRDEWLLRFGKPWKAGGASWITDMRAAEYAAAHTRPGQGVLVWGFEPAVYLFSGRRPPTRFFFNVGPGVTYTPPAWREEFLTTVSAHPPELLLVAHNDAIPWANGTRQDSAAQLRAWPELDRWVREHYRLEIRIDALDVYRLFDTETRRHGDRHGEAQQEERRSGAASGRSGP